jgi:hypothetical protein
MDHYIEALNANTALAQEQFGGLSNEQFNFKPAPDQWSIGQCLLHLVKTNKGYFPIYERFLDGTYEPNFFERLGWFSGFWERLFIHGVDPKNVKKMKAPASIQPSQSHIDKSIIDKLGEQNKLIASYYNKLQPMHPDQLIVSSPFAKFIVYNLDTTFRIVNLHEQRHLQQAMRVKEHAHA